MSSFPADPSKLESTASAPSSTKTMTSAASSGVVTVGQRSTLPTLFVQDETAPQKGADALRFRNRSEEGAKNGRGRKGPAGGQRKREKLWARGFETFFFISGKKMFYCRYSLDDLLLRHLPFCCLRGLRRGDLSW